jgi:tetratricopeptide (TPR) repeat protein
MAWTDALIILGLAAGTLAVYGRAREAEFLNFDDPLYVSQNEHVLSGLGIANFAWAFTTFAAANWHPLTWLSLQLDATLFGTGPAGFHVVNVALHAANAILVFLCLRRLTAARWPSALVAGLFAWHPLHVESVSWISERKDVLSTLFGLLALLAYARYVEKPSCQRYLAVTTAFALSLLAKPMLVTLPCLLLLLDYWPLERWPGQPAAVSFRRLVLEKLPLLALAGVSSAITLTAQHLGGAVQSLNGASVAPRIANALASYVAYLGQTMWPAELGTFYPYQQRGLFEPHVLGATAVLAAVSGLVLAALRARPYLAVGWFWYVGTLVPVIGLVQVGLQSRADRYTYFPLLGIFVALAWAAADVARRGRLAQAVIGLGAIVALSGSAVAARVQVGHWRTSESIWRQTLRVTGPNDNAWVNLGSALTLKGRSVEALACFDHALTVNSRNAKAFYNRGLLLMRDGQPERAGRDFEAAVAADLGDALAHANLGIFLARQGDRGGAICQYEEAIRLDPDVLPARANLGMELLEDGRLEEARDQLAEAAQRHPRAAQAHFGLGVVYTMLGRYDDAAAALGKSVRLDRSQPFAWHQFAQLQGLQGRWHDAVEFARQATAMAQERGELRGHLAFCLARSSDPIAASHELEESRRTDPHWPLRLGRRVGRWATHWPAGGAAVVYLAQVCSFAGDDRDPELLDVLAAAQAQDGQ